MDFVLELVPISNNNNLFYFYVKKAKLSPERWNSIDIVSNFISIN